ncbi:hypothetical protein KI387_003233, partial [Taxus chinensis]
TTAIVPSPDSPTSDIASHDTSHTSLYTPSYYVDDPIDNILIDIIISESLSDTNQAFDSHGSPYFHTIECESPIPSLPSAEIAFSTLHKSPPSITSFSPTVLSPPITSFAPICSSSHIDVFLLVTSPIRDVYDASPTITMDIPSTSTTIDSSTPTTSVPLASESPLSSLDIPMITHNGKLQPLNTLLPSSTIPSQDIISLMHVIGQLQSQVQSLTLESRAYYASIDSNSLHGNPVPKEIHNSAFPKNFIMPTFTCFDGTGDPHAHLLCYHMCMTSYYDDKLLLKAF